MSKEHVVITGGTCGLGLAMAKHLAGLNYAVTVIGRNYTPEIDAVIAEHQDVRCIEWDLTNLAMLPQLMRPLHRPIFALINNAGIGTSGVLYMMDSEKIEYLIKLNLTVPIILTKLVLSDMLAGYNGRIINISSIVATDGFQGLAAYSASKAGLLGFTRSLAREVGPANITVNAIAPGFLDTEMTHDMNEKQREQIVRRSALRRLANPEDIASTVAFLLQASNITGQVLTVDAGNTT